MKKLTISFFLLFLLSAVCFISICMAWKEYAVQGRDKEIFEQLTQLVELPNKADESYHNTTKSELDISAITDEFVSTMAEKETVEQKRNLVSIMEQNNECIGWIYIEGTAVNYPVMHSPNDPQKYLRKNFYGEYSMAGVPFLDYRCTLESNLIVYGHNMKDGTMFFDIKQYLDMSFREKHRIIEFETKSSVSYYTVVDVIKTDIYDQRYNNIVIEDGRQMLILSTCDGSEKSGRLIVIAKKN